MSGFEIAYNDVSDVNRIRSYVSSAAARKIAIGDVVIATGTSDATTGDPLATNSADGSITASSTGVVVGIKPLLSTESLSSTGVAASTACTIFVCDDPNTLFECESDATLDALDVGLNVGYNALEATLAGVLYTSNYTLDAATKNTTATLPFQIVKLLKGKTSGTLGDRALVRINGSTVKPGATGV